jgi:hypothetical protein
LPTLPAAGARSSDIEERVLVRTLQIRNNVLISTLILSRPIATSLDVEPGESGDVVLTRDNSRDCYLVATDGSGHCRLRLPKPYR